MSIFVFHNEQARMAVCKGQRVFSRKKFSKEAIQELEAFDKKGQKRLFTFVD